MADSLVAPHPRPSGARAELVSDTKTRSNPAKQPTGGAGATKVTQDERERPLAAKRYRLIARNAMTQSEVPGRNEPGRSRDAQAGALSIGAFERKPLAVAADAAPMGIESTWRLLGRAIGHPAGAELYNPAPQRAVSTES